MFKQMRRIKQVLPEEMTLEVVNKCGTGTMGIITEDGYPYTVPVNYVYADGKIYMHGAKGGQRIEAIKANDKVSFSIIELDELHPEKLTTFFRSVSIFGRARLVECEEEKMLAMRALCDKFCKYVPAAQVEAELSDLSNTSVVCIDIESMVGKEAIELVKEREARK